MEQGYRQTLCWGCQNAVPSPSTGAGCPWSRAGKPVEGWRATRRDVLMQRMKGYSTRIESYLVTACPLFLTDGPPKSGRDTVHTKEGKDVREITWDTAKARALKSEGLSNKEIADMVGTTGAAVGSYFSRVAAEARLLQEKLAETMQETTGPPVGPITSTEEVRAAQPLTVHDAAELLYALDQLFPGARLECGATEGIFSGMELSLHIREGEDTPDVTVWLK